MATILASLLHWFREAFTDNVGLKALSLAFAIGMFIYMHGQEDIQDRTIPVGVVMRLPTRQPNESEGRELMTQVRPSVHVTLRGSARALDRLVQAGVPPVELDLRDGRTTTVSFEHHLFSLPPDVEITIVDPPSIALEWQDVVTRELPVQASISGTPAEGYVVQGEPEVDPQVANARGPVGLVEVLQFARLAPFDVSGLSEGAYRRRIAIDAPPNRISYVGAQSVMVTVNITRRLTEAKFNRLPVEVVGIPHGTANPRYVNVTVIGPPDVVRALRAEQVVPRVDVSKSGVDLETTKHGSITIEITVDVANADAEVQPPTATVKW